MRITRLSHAFLIRKSFDGYWCESDMTIYNIHLKWRLVSLLSFSFASSQTPKIPFVQRILLLFNIWKFEYLCDILILLLFLRDVLYLGLHVLYCTFVYFSCTAPLFTCIVPHRRLHVLYFTAPLFTCTVLHAPLFTCSILHLCIHAHFLKTASLSVCTVHCTVNLITLYFIALKLQRMKDNPLFDLLQKNYIFRELNSFL